MAHGKTWLLGSVLCLLGSTLLAAEPIFHLVQAIVNPENQARADFGRSVVVTSEGIVIGSSLDNGVGKESGAVYFFNHNGVLQKKVTQPDRFVGANFGHIMATTVSGDVAVGNFTEIQPDDVDRSRVYIYDAFGNLKETLTSPTSVIGEYGIGLAAIGDTILVGSLRDSTAAFHAGAVYAYAPGQAEPRMFVSPAPVERALLGRFITPLGGSKFVASAYTESFDGAFATGAAYIFDLSSDDVVRIPDPNPRDYNYFGIGTGTLNGNVLVGAIEFEGQVPTGGVAYMFDQQGQLLQQFNNPHPDNRDFFGYKLTGVGDYVVVGAQQDGTNGPLSGAAYVFDQKGNLLQELHDPTPGDSGSFGLVQSFGDTLVVSAAFDGGGPNAVGPGAVYIYKLNLLPGDVNMDNRVNLDDFITLRKHFGQDVNARADGDLTGDLKVDLADFIQLRANFGKVAPVPEPGGVVLTLLTAGGLAWMGLRWPRQ